MPRVLLIEDDPSVAKAISLGLRRFGYDLDHAPDGRADLTPRVDAADIVVLDLGLPGPDGYAIGRDIRSRSNVPIIILTARSDDADVVASLESGADDYVVKPVSPRVLDARIKAVLRRGSSEEQPLEDAVISHGPLVIAPDSFEVTLHGEPVAVTPIEFRMLQTLATHAGRVLSRDQLYRLAWESDYRGDSRAVDAAIARLRQKIHDGDGPPRIVTVRGFGYRFDTA